jgi:hypothetical protein
MKPATKSQDPMPQTHLTVLQSVGSVGRPIVHTEASSKITLVMDEHHVVFLDLVSLCIRAKHGRAVPRAEIIRALVEFMQRSRIDFSRFGTIDEMIEYLRAYFQAIPNAGKLPLLESSLFSSTRGADDDGRRGGPDIDESPMNT